MGADKLGEKVWEKYQYSSNLPHCQLRGYAPECVAFIYDAWRSPEVLEIVSKIAGIDLVPVMDWEIGHINIAVKSEDEKIKELHPLLLPTPDCCRPNSQISGESMSLENQRLPSTTHFHVHIASHLSSGSMSLRIVYLPSSFISIVPKRCTNLSYTGPNGSLALPIAARC